MKPLNNGHPFGRGLVAVVDECPLFRGCGKMSYSDLSICLFCLQIWGVHTPTRTPLQDVNRSSLTHTPGLQRNSVTKSAGLLKRAQYSQVTPFSSRVGQTSHRCAVLKYAGSNVSDSQDVMLNSLIYKKLNDILQQKQMVIYIFWGKNFP